jgi:hypothetical protein
MVYVPTSLRLHRAVDRVALIQFRLRLVVRSAEWVVPGEPMERGERAATVVLAVEAA